jgi:hypothetical protein
LSPVVIQGVPHPRYLYPRWIREYFAYFLTLSTAINSAGIPSNDQIQLLILSVIPGG